jgi:hypothetical protein
MCRVLTVFLLGYCLYSIPAPLKAERSPEDVPFKWVDRAKESSTLRKIEAALSSELLPDVPEKVAPVVPYGYKYIKRAGVIESSALVFVAERQSRDDREEFVVVYNVNLATGEKSEIDLGSPLWNWKYYGRAHFERSGEADILFSFFECLHCEGAQLLGALHYSQFQRMWMSRTWGPQENAVMIGAVEDTADGSLLKTDCIYGVRDFLDRGVAQIGTWCRAKVYGPEGSGQVSPAKYTAKLFGVENGKEQVHQLTDTSQRRRVLSGLCSASPSSTLCRRSVVN